ncbi:MAG TPA: methylated-DNA--[protein]-cysteine S-methyltransferase [Actinomycetota bacterium]|jgi:methylated-DNA-[protein]-cysteine S-methyltransferase|nr:methylated-DNA--[protein]-cysteine S-methyltransferase [Actinomycetota bacterium]
MKIPTTSFDAEARAASDRLVKRAEREGLLDVAYAVVESPLGPLVAATTPRGLARLAYGEEERVLEELARTVSPRILQAPTRLNAVRRQLDQYFAGRRREFDLDVDLALVHGFSRRVLRATARIPFGDVRTYAQVASRAGSPRASRAAGNALGANPVPIVVPCHRVVHSGGGLGGYTGGLDRKEYLLALEGVIER